MTTRTAATDSARRWARTAAVAAAAAVILAGCSASDYEAVDYSGADAALASEDSGGGEALAEAYAAEDGDAAPAEADRSVIVTGSMYMTVEDPIAAAEEATSIVRSAGGRIDARSETAPEEGDGGAAWMTLRIPSDDLEDVVDDLRGLGTVDEFTTESYDVTTQVTDLESQISTLRASTERIQMLLVEAEDIGDIIALENELDGRQAELESLEARQRGLDDQVSMSTLDLSLTTEPVVIVDDDPKSFWDGLVAGWEGLTAFVAGTLVVVGVLLPWLALMTVIALVVLVVVRALRARKARRAAPAAQPVGATASGTGTTPTDQS
ncbi:DUF4349 domain-containing protein [Demequina sp. NBRC 110056]|uniref:DUF4349 domain-containing protein n=1 Tax=Demequina sp. NBRC 110056 TaxID=1570345 RepID=UPI00135664E3|nr:DUF4349 domain-containing protein [Demequina sp. NBRC 110056]